MHAHDEPHAPADALRSAVVMDVLRTVRNFGDAHDRMSVTLKHGMKMNMSDLQTLRLLIMREEQGVAVSPRDIATHLRISTASTTKLIDRLSQSGHVRRAPHPSDRRARVVELTDVARAGFFQRYGTQLAAIREALAPFDATELDAAMRVLGAVGTAIEPAEEV